MPNPLLNPAVLLSPIEGGYVAYDPLADRLHLLNPVAALLAELCDGARTLEQLRAVAAPLLPAGAADAVDRWVTEATEAGLLGGTGGAREAAAGLGPAELSALAGRLRSAGKIQTAYLCQQRSAELLDTDDEAWELAGELAHILGKRAEAREHYARCFALRPGDPELRHLLRALRDEPAPARVPDDCVAQLYRRFSTFYEANMLDDLDYQAPEVVEALVQRELGERTGLAVLDLGCGSGLAAARLSHRAARLVGIDLSPEMLALAKGRGLYHLLEACEITAWLEANREQFDLVVACDSLIYFGDLRPVLAGAARALRPGGVFVLTVERGQVAPYRLADSGRYCHHPEHLREAAAAAGLVLASMEEAYLRMEYGEEVIGLCAALRREEGVR
jgi:predicted TPR repeat methyltransferase